MIQRFLFIFLLSWMVVLPSLAEEVGAGSEPVQSDQDSSGEVKIKEEKDETISEFRINGQLYMIRITPKKGTPYYLVDSDGDGNLETRWNELAPELLIPAWVLLRW